MLSYISCLERLVRASKTQIVLMSVDHNRSSQNVIMVFSTQNPQLFDLKVEGSDPTHISQNVSQISRMTVMIF